MIIVNQWIRFYRYLQVDFLFSRKKIIFHLSIFDWEIKNENLEEKTTRKDILLREKLTTRTKKSRIINNNKNGKLCLREINKTDIKYTRKYAHI